MADRSTFESKPTPPGSPKRSSTTRKSATRTAPFSQPSELELARASPAGFLFQAKREAAEPWIPYRAHLLIDKHLTEVAAGRTKLLVLQVPVQTGKTMLGSVGNSVWTLGQFPGKTVAAFSYTTDFAIDKIGRPARNLMEQFGPNVFGVGVDPRSNAAFRWDLVDRAGHPTGGGFYCGGVDTGLAGRKIDLAIIDDPIGLAVDAENPRVRESVWRWYQRDLRQRLNPSSAVIWIMSRWDPDDPVGRLIKHTLANNIPMTLVDLPAIALDPEVDEAADAPARRELQLAAGSPYRDALGRKPGQALCPELRPLAFLEDQKRSAGSRVFAANYQGRPMASGGTIYRREWFREAVLEHGVLRLFDRSGATVEVVPLVACRRFAMCDPATGKPAESKQQAERLAFFVIGAAAMTPKFNLVILDILRNKDPGTEQLGHLLTMSRTWSVERVGIEDVGYQSTLIQYAVQRGLPCVPIRRGRESKESRARFAAARYEAGSVYHRTTLEPWRTELDAELELFPAGYKDQADVIADCIAVVALAAERNTGAYGARVQRGISFG